MEIMDKKTVTKVLLLLLATTGACWACGCTENLATSQPERTDVNSIETILKQLNQKTEQLKSYQAQVEYLFSQPLLESKTLRKGVLYYQKCDQKSKLRINFQTLKQDDEEQQKYIEHYIFDGVWLTHIDYQIKEVKRYQQAEPNQPVDAFDLASQNFPIIGFTKVEDLRKQFEIKLIEREEHTPVIPAEPVPSEVEGAGIHKFIRLHLKVKPDSIYKDDYTSIDFWIDRELYLPAKIVAVSTEEDIYELKLLNPKVNKKIDKKVFEFKIPKDFGQEIIPLKRKD
jgi:outer membrane lipoprotein-sorting protein